MDPNDPRIATSSADEVDADIPVGEIIDDDGISEPFPSLSTLSGEGDNVPPELSSGDSISDEGIDGDEGAPDIRPSGAPGRRSISRLHKDTNWESGGSKARDATSKPPSLGEWEAFFSRVVLKTACQWYVNYAFRGIDEDMLTDREVDRLMMTDEERQLIATPFAELSNKSKFMRKHGRSIVATGDSFQALVVLGAWMSRVNRIAAKYRPRNPRVRINPEGPSNGSSGQGTTPTNATGFAEGTHGGRVPNGYPVYRPGTG